MGVLVVWVTPLGRRELRRHRGLQKCAEGPRARRGPSATVGW
jgi:hypothetical protein